MLSMEFIHTNNRSIFCYLFVYLVLLSTFHIKTNSGFSRARFQEFQHKLMRCCQSFPEPASSNSSGCTRLKKMFQEELDREGFMSSRSYKYTKKLWRSIAHVTNQVGEQNEPSLIYWTVNATKAGKTTNSFLTFKRPQISGQENNNTKTTHKDILTRLELIIPYYTYPQNSCQPRFHEHDDIFISIDDKNISSDAGIVPLNNLLVFHLLSSLNCSKDCNSLNVNVQEFPHHVIPRLKHAMLLEYYNIDETNMDNIRSIAQRHTKKIRSRKEKKRNKHIAENRERRSPPEKKSGFPKLGLQNPIETRSLKLKSDFRKRFCRLHNYKVSVQYHLNMRYVLEPKEINVGMCKGQCNALHLKGTSSFHTSRSVFLNLLLHPPEGLRRLTSGCVPDKMQPLTVLLIDSGMLTMKVYPAATIHSCRCI